MSEIGQAIPQHQAQEDWGSKVIEHGWSRNVLVHQRESRLLVEYALRDLNKPVGVSGYMTELLASLPDPEGWEAELAKHESKENDEEVGDGE